MIAGFGGTQNKKNIIKSPLGGILYKETGLYFRSHKK
jgi:hypothetical protein